MNRRPFFLVCILMISSLACSLIAVQPGPTPEGKPPIEGQPSQPIEQPPQRQSGEAQADFSADRTSISAGECVTLQWNVQGGFGADINGETVELSGSKQVCPPDTTQYVLSVDVGTQILQREVTVTVQGSGPGTVRTQSIQIDQMVNIPGGGGSVEITFEISSGQWVHIQLTAGNPGMQPYGSLQYPDGTSQYCPQLETVANGMNQIDILLTNNGRYTLTFFDGSNQGGPVSVKITGSQ